MKAILCALLLVALVAVASAQYLYGGYGRGYYGAPLAYRGYGGYGYGAPVYGGYYGGYGYGRGLIYG